MNDENYMDFVNNQIEINKLLSSVKPEDRKYVKKLFDKKKEIIKKNGFFANIQLKVINKKIEKKIKNDI